jgi:uncharacterized protein (DUF2225 family)
MTMLGTKTHKCYVCQTESEHTIVMSTISMGYADLDFRHPEMRRSTLEFDIQRCPNCSYCSYDISVGTTVVKELVISPDYKAIIENQDLPILVASFLASTMINVRLKKYKSAVRESLSAAWVFDDRGSNPAAQVCRKSTAELMMDAFANKQHVSNHEGQAGQILVDVLRRAEMFTEALAIIKKLRNKKFISIENKRDIMRLVDFEEKLIIKKDIDAHTIGEALGEE